MHFWFYIGFVFFVFCAARQILKYQGEHISLITMQYALCFMLSFSVLCVADSTSGYEAYTEWEEWARLRLGVKSGLASSYDRMDGNYDWSHYEFPEGLVTEEVVATVKTITGPGMIYRFWMPHVMARNDYAVRMYFDGEETPRIDTDSNSIMSGLYSYFGDSLVTTCAGGQVCYEPIGFSESLRIETINKEAGVFANRHYYQYSYLTFPPGTNISSYTGTLTPDVNLVRSSVVSMFDNIGEHPFGESGTAISVSTSEILASGENLRFDLPGPGIIRRLNLQLGDANDTELYGLQLRVYYDGKSEAAIDVSVAHFFGAGKDRAAYKSLPLGTEATDANEGFYCYWPMPFHESARIEFLNTTGGSINIELAKVEYESKTIDREMCYLYVTKNALVKQAGQIYHTLLSTEGRGHYAGDLLYVEQEYDSFNMLEGDDVIIVDGVRTQNGTGLEDTYNGGAYYNWVAVQLDEPEGAYPQSATRPLSGILYVHKEEGLARADQYRWRIADCIPFSRSIEVMEECRYAQTGSKWTSVAFWYQLPYPLEDIDADGAVDLKDFAMFSESWLDTGCGRCGGAEFTGDGQVGMDDLREFTSSWLIEL